MYLRIIVTVNKAVAVLASHKGEEYNEAIMQCNVATVGQVL